MTKSIRRKRILKKTVSVSLTYLLLVVLAVIFSGPFLWLLVTSFRSGQNIYDLNWFSSSYSLGNYIGVINYLSIPHYFLNTIFITFFAIVIDVIFSSLCAFPLAMMEFPGKKIILGILISSMIIPAAAGLVVKYLIVSSAHLLNTYLAVILPGCVTVFSVILLRQSYLGIPKELLDAASIDGASELRIWAKILLPQIKPTISTIIIFDFIASWNSFLWPIIVLQDPQKYPLATALSYLNGQFNYNFGYIAAGTIIAILPVIIVFIAFQKYFVESIAGGVKG